MMIESGRSFTRISLKTAIEERLGEDARYFTCSAENLTPDELIDFLAARGKFVEPGEGLTTAPDRICHHG